MFSIASRLFTFILLFLFSAAAFNGDSGAPNQTTVRSGQEFTIKVGQHAQVEGADLAIKFVGVSQDSRCPRNVTCVWAGNAEVALEVAYNKCNSSVTLNTHARTNASDEGKVGEFRVKLVKLDPYPQGEQKISPEDYVATLLLTKE